jgi:N-hydroxyarylamine O-acetyltransferase
VTSSKVTWRDWRRRLAATADISDHSEMAFKTGRSHNMSRSEQIALKAAFCDAALYRIWLDNFQPCDSAAAPDPLDGHDPSLLPVTVARAEKFASLLLIQEKEAIFTDWSHDEFKKLWRSKESFFEEAIKYLFRPSVYLSRAISVQNRIRKELLPKAATIEELAVQAAQLEMDDALTDPLVELGAIVATSLPQNPVVRGLLAELDRVAGATWTSLYREIIEHYGVRLRVGVKVEDFTELAAIITEGSLARSRTLSGHTSGGEESSRPPMAVALGYVIRGILADSEIDTASAAVSSRTLGRYLRHVEFDGEVNCDLDTLVRLQGAHLDAFSYSNLDVFLGKPYPIGPEGYLDYLIETGHGGMCYQLNVGLAAILRAIGFEVDYLWGTVGSAPGRPGWPDGNHLGLQVTCEGAKWLVDAGLGDGPRQPFRLETRKFDQDGFVYDIADQGDKWIFTHAKGSSFGEVVFKKEPVQLAAFEEPARLQMTSPRSSFLETTHVIKRRADKVWNMRGLKLKVRSVDENVERFIRNKDDWFHILKNEFGIYLGNMTMSERTELWERVS